MGSFRKRAGTLDRDMGPTQLFATAKSARPETPSPTR
jgi:hypothetical protein